MVTDTHCIRLVNRIGIVEGIKEPKKWRWFCGSWFRRRREAISAIVSFTMDGMYALPEQSPIVSAAACLTSVRKQEYKILFCEDREEPDSFKNTEGKLKTEEKGRCPTSVKLRKVRMLYGRT